MRLHCFFTVNSSINAAGDHLAGRSFMEKALNIKRLFSMVRCSRVEPMVPGPNPIPNSFFPSFFFSVFVLLFSINI